VLHDACVKLGGEHALAHYLAVDPQTVHAWLEGHETPSDISFIKCLDLLGTV
jgi:DNA-binding transcriptional regulator YiaG